MNKSTLQKVEVVNFPKKDVWDKLQIIVTILALIIAIISTSLYINEINKRPDVEIDIFSPTPIRNKVLFNFKNGFSDPLEFDVSLHNIGNERSESASLFIAFSSEVDISLRNYENWREQQFGDVKAFTFEDRSLIINEQTNRGIGVFDISIPKKDEEILIAYFMIEGDFDRKFGLIYYDYANRRYVLKHYKEHLEPEQIWNKHL
jgi:hypothetical protein